MVQDKDLKDCLQRIGNPTIIQLVLQIIQQLLLELSEPVDSPRLSFKARTNNTYKPLNFAINDLVVLSLFRHNGDFLCELLIDESDEPTFAKVFNIFNSQKGDGNSKAYWIRVSATEVVSLLIGDVYAIWQDKCRSQLTKSTASPYRNTRTDELHRMVQDVSFRKAILQELFPNTIDKTASKLPIKEKVKQSEILPMNNTVHHSLNTILYGPPGTGKTYHTIEKAVQIINPSFFNENRSRSDIKKEFEQLKELGHIEFVTFHQSMSYEEFIEGIKPKTPEEGDEFLKYLIEEGIFKKIAKRADYHPTLQEKVFSISEQEFNRASFYKISLGNTAIADDEQIYRFCIDNGYMALGWGGANDFAGKTESEIQQMVPGQIEKFAAQAVNYFIHYIKQGDYVVVSLGNLRFRAIGKITGEYEFKSVPGIDVKQFRRVQWLLKDVNIPVEELYEKQFSQQSIYKLNKLHLKKSFLVHNSFKIEEPVLPREEHVSYDALYHLFLEKIKSNLAEHNGNEPYYLNSKNGRIKVSQVIGDRIITRGENAGADEPIYKERVKQIYEVYPTPQHIKTVGDLRNINTAIGWTSNYYAVFKALKEFESTLEKKSEIAPPNKQIKQDLSTNNYVLIIDEINRGNIAQIFGELITLIEPDKRKGASEELALVLPYSRESFSVPSNLYILGTMNTADRSVEALDTALRRRFSFKEIAPNKELLSFKNMLCVFWNQPEHIFTTTKQWMQEPYLTKTNAFYRLIGFSREKEREVLEQGGSSDRYFWLPEDMDVISENDFTGVNLKTLLHTINNRLEKLLTKDHQIGHAFFINVFSEADLYNAFYQKLIPQLQEYFYGDFGKIGLVLGSAFVKLKEEKSKVGFATFPYDDVQMLQEKKVYRIHDFNAEGQTNLDDFIAAVKQVYQ